MAHEHSSEEPHILRIADYRKPEEGSHLLGTQVSSMELLRKLLIAAPRSAVMREFLRGVPQDKHRGRLYINTLQRLRGTPANELIQILETGKSEWVTHWQYYQAVADALCEQLDPKFKIAPSPTENSDT